MTSSIAADAVGAEPTASMEARLTELRAAAMSKARVSGVSQKRTRSASPSPAAPASGGPSPERAARARSRSPSLSRSPSRSVSRSPPRARSRSPARVRRRRDEDARERRQYDRREREGRSGRGGLGYHEELQAERDYGRSRRRDYGRDRDRDRDRGRDRDRDPDDRYDRDYRYREQRPQRDRSWDRDRERDRDRDRYPSPPRGYRSHEKSDRYGFEGGAGGDGVGGRYERDSYRGRRRGYGRPIVTGRSEAPSEERDARTVFVWQLSQKVHEDDVYEMFSQAGRVRNVTFITDRRSGRHKGQGYVEFYEALSVPDALRMNGRNIRGFPVAVKAHSQGSSDAVALAGATASAIPVSIPQPPPPPMPISTSSPGRPVTPTGTNVPPPLASAGGSPLFSAMTPSGGPPTGTAPFSSLSTPVAAPPTAETQVVPHIATPEELIRLLNPNNVPLPPAASTTMGAVAVHGGSAGKSGITATPVADLKLPESEQVPLPIAGMPSVPVHTQPASASPASAFTRLYVGSVPFTVSEDDLLTIFKPFGDVISLQLQRESATGRSRGYGFVEFAQHEAAKKALALNGLVLAGRTLKVNLASSTAAPLAPLAAARAAAAAVEAGSGTGPVPLPGPVDLPGAQEGERAGELDEGRDGGLAMNANQRALLMQRLSRGENMGATPASSGATYNPPCATTDEESRCLLLSNMFDPVEEAKTNPAFELELAEDVRDEVTEKYGAVKHLFVDKSSHGLIYLVFDDIGSAQRAKAGLDGRWFGGKKIAAAYVTEEVYKERLPTSPL